MARTLQELAKEALQVQDACNIAGVALAFGPAMIDLREHCSGTAERNRHVITQAWVCKLADLSLSGFLSGSDINWSELYRLADNTSFNAKGTTP